jgi:hypothetical protein
MSPVEQLSKVGLAVTACGNQFTIAITQDRVGSPRTAAAIRGKRRVKSPPFLAIMLRKVSVILASLAAVIGFAGLPNNAQAQKRVALVVGNSAYEYVPKLTNPANDARDMAAALKALGFEVVEGIDLDKAAFDHKVLDFAAAV